MFAMQELSSALNALQIETKAAFDWLADGLDRRTPVTFVPNPGNIGDGLINFACWQYLCTRFDGVAICSMQDRPMTECVFIGGGGNLVEPLYQNVSSFLERLGANQRPYIFPVTVYGYAKLLRSVGPRVHIICRENTSFQFMLEQVDAANVRLGHDAAFSLAASLQADFARKASRKCDLEARLYRMDRESIISEIGGLDIMGQHHSDWVDMSLAKNVMHLAANYILGFGRIYTDRLHCAILAAMLGRATVLCPNSYFKNAAAFEHSLSRLPNVRFDARSAVNKTPDTDPVAYLHNRESA